MCDRTDSGFVPRGRSRIVREARALRGVSVMPDTLVDVRNVTISCAYTVESTCHQLPAGYRPAARRARFDREGDRVAIEAVPASGGRRCKTFRPNSLRRWSTRPVEGR